jgi:hypothetical protein
MSCSKVPPPPNIIQIFIKIVDGFQDSVIRPPLQYRHYFKKKPEVISHSRVPIPPHVWPNFPVTVKKYLH